MVLRRWGVSSPVAPAITSDTPEFNFGTNRVSHGWRLRCSVVPIATMNGRSANGWHISGVCDGGTVAAPGPRCTVRTRSVPSSAVALRVVALDEVCTHAPAATERLRISPARRTSGWAEAGCSRNQQSYMLITVGSEVGGAT